MQCIEELFHPEVCAARFHGEVDLDTLPGKHPHMQHLTVGYAVLAASSLHALLAQRAILVSTQQDDRCVCHAELLGMQPQQRGRLRQQTEIDD